MPFSFARNRVCSLQQSVNTTVQALTTSFAALAEFDTATGTPVKIEEGGLTAVASTAVVTVPSTGRYLCLLTATITPPAATPTVTLAIKKGTTTIGGTINTHVCVSGVEFTLTTHCVADLVAGDTVRPAIMATAAANHTTDEAMFTVLELTG